MDKLNFRQPRVPLNKLEILQIQSTPISPIKRSIRISSQKLPTGFFSETRKKLQLHEVNTSKPIKKLDWNFSKGLNMAIKAEKHIDTCKTADSSRTQQLTDGQNEQQLIMKLIQTTRGIKSMIRKHSLQVKQTQRLKNELIFELPPLKTARNKQTP